MTDAHRHDEPGGSSPHALHEADAVRVLLGTLAALTRPGAPERTSLAAIMQALGDRAVLPLIVLFALPNMVPMPPGTSTVLGIPLVFFSLQWSLGRRPWLPAFVGRWSVPTHILASLVDRASGWLDRNGRWLRPRLTLFASRRWTPFAGWLCALLAFILALPIPLGNILPALAIVVLTLGMMQRDGVWVLGGLIATMVSFGVVWSVVVALRHVDLSSLLRYFG